jgi:hypothetical protein
MSGPAFPQIDDPDEPVTMTRAQAVNLAISAERGEALSNWIATTALFGHARPGNTLDYAHHIEEWTAEAFVRDFVAWTSGRERFAPGCADRLREWGMAEAGIRSGRIMQELGLDGSAREEKTA